MSGEPLILNLGDVLKHEEEIEAWIRRFWSSTYLLDVNLTVRTEIKNEAVRLMRRGQRLPSNEAIERIRSLLLWAAELERDATVGQFLGAEIRRRLCDPSICPKCCLVGYRYNDSCPNCDDLKSAIGPAAP